MRCATDIPCAFNTHGEFLIRVNVDVCPRGTSICGEIDGVEARCIGWRQRRFAVGFDEAVVSAPDENEGKEREDKTCFS